MSVPDITSSENPRHPSWLGYRERGSVFAYWLIARLALLLGRRVTRLLLYPICVYYLLFSRTTPRASRAYLTRVLGRPPRLAEVFRHHLYFATALLDRVYLYSGQYDKFEVVCHNTEVLQEVFASGRGVLMLGAHLGSFEFMRASAAHRRYGFTSNMMMYEDNARKIATVLDGLDKHKERRIIPIGRVDALLMARERLDRGELVGILGDRAVGNDRLVWVPFLGRPAPFPAGPFLAAAALQTPVILFYCLYDGGDRYELHFERLTERMTITRRSPTELEAWVRRYAARLEHYCRLSPYNWFNFYDFWGDQNSNGGTPPGTG